MPDFPWTGLFFGFHPGSIGETSAFLCFFGCHISHGDPGGQFPHHPWGHCRGDHHRIYFQDTAGPHRHLVFRRPFVSPFFRGICPGHFIYGHRPGVGPGHGQWALDIRLSHRVFHGVAALGEPRLCGRGDAFHSFYECFFSIDRPCDPEDHSGPEDSQCLNQKNRNKAKESMPLNLRPYFRWCAVY